MGRNRQKDVFEVHYNLGSKENYFNKTVMENILITRAETLEWLINVLVTTQAASVKPVQNMLATKIA